MTSGGLSASTSVAAVSVLVDRLWTPPALWTTLGRRQRRALPSIPWQEQR
jgi:hypothetical protein